MTHTINGAQAKALIEAMQDNCDGGDVTFTFREPSVGQGAHGPLVVAFSFVTAYIDADGDVDY